MGTEQRKPLIHLLGVGLCVFPAFLLLRSPLGEWFQCLSFDAAFLACPEPKSKEFFTNVLVVEFSQEQNQRTNHAKVLDKLTEDRARLVVFDVLFDLNKPEQDDRFAAAIRRNGKVLLAVTNKESTYSDGSTAIRTEGPGELTKGIETNARGLGSVNFPMTGSAVRAHAKDGGSVLSLAFVAATNVGVFSASNDCWLNLYSDPSPIPKLDYDQVQGQTNGFFNNKVVFIGAYDQDIHSTAFTRWKGSAGNWPGVTILASNFLNLVRGDSIRRMSAWKEYLLILSVGLVLGSAAGVFTNQSGALRARYLLSGLLMLLVAIPIGASRWVWDTHIWFNWAAISLWEIPVSAVACLAFARLRREKYVPRSAPLHPAPHQLPPIGHPDWKPSVPGHVVHSAIGKGGYGQVWLAHNIHKTFRAVKVVFREKDGKTVGYEKEFKALRDYEPISRKHPGLLPILHVDEDKEQAYFYYIMELADDERPAHKIAENDYCPRTLAGDLKRLGSLTLKEAVAVGIAIADALEFLHTREPKLVHRDVKPLNIVYIEGQARLADPGLVTALDRSEVSRLGTLIYMDPDTHGEPLGDVYSLGLTLSRIAPQPSTLVENGTASPLPYSASTLPYSDSSGDLCDPRFQAEFDEIVRKARAPRTERFQSARELCDALKALQQKIP